MADRELRLRARHQVLNMYREEKLEQMLKVVTEFKRDNKVLKCLICVREEQELELSVIPEVSLEKNMRICLKIDREPEMDEVVIREQEVITRLRVLNVRS